MIHKSRQTYTVVLVVVTQQLAIHGILLRRQNLTATHDESTAWIGLGSALLVLLKQTRIAASVVGVSLITIYLVGISVLHISTPSLFTLQVFELSNSTTISKRIGMPKIEPDGSAGSHFMICIFFLLTIWLTRDRNSALTWNDVVSDFSYLTHADLGNTIGVQNGTLYDVLGDNNGTGTVAVGATSFNVSCGSFSNTTALGNGANPTTWTVYANDANTTFQLGRTGKAAVFS
jgi:hypothetical protein